MMFVLEVRRASHPKAESAELNINHYTKRGFISPPLMGSMRQLFLLIYTRSAALFMITELRLGAISRENFGSSPDHTAVESARKVSERAAQATQNAEVEAILESRHGASVKSKRLTKKQKQAAAAALDSEENIQDA